MTWLPVVGDQKVFVNLHKLKRQYGKDLDWLIPMPGDWHMLKNFQPVLMKIYFHSGLRELAQQAGYEGANLTAFESSSNFKHTHLFLLEAFEGCYLYALEEFLATCPDCSPGDAHLKFMHFMQQRSAEPTPKLWVNFLQDVGTYVKFWLSLRCSNWDVRVGCVKEMAALFHAFNRPNYSELTLLHLADLWQLPEPVASHFKDGAFTASVKGVPTHDQGLDEAHETIVNRKTKEAIKRADPSYIEENAHYLPYRAVITDNLKRQVSCRQDSDVPKSSQASQGNVKAILAKLRAVRPFSFCEDLSNVFTGKTATKEEVRGMLDCHSIGRQKVATLFESRVMHLPSTNAPICQEKLRTMSCTKKKKVARKANPHKLMVLSLKAQLLRAQQLNSAPDIHQQFFILPKAMVDDNGLSRKGQKSVTRKVLTTRYPGVVSAHLPASVTGDMANTVVVIDGMFTLQTLPLTQHRSVLDYVMFWVQRWVKPMFALGNHVHLVWDHPCRHGVSPKGVEHW